MDDLLPNLQQLLSEANSDQQCQTSPNFLQVLQQNLVPAQTFTQSFLKTVLLALDTSDLELSTIWLNMLLEAIAILPAQTVCCEILPTAINKSQISEPLNTRLIACRILGKMCSTFSLEILRREAVPTVIALSQDVLWDVRAHICDELGAAGPLVAESPLLLMSLVDLTNDENCTVRAAAVNTLSGVVEHLQPEVMISVVTPLVLKFSKEYDLEVLQTIAKNIGKLCSCLQDHISESEKQSLLSFYQVMTQIGLHNTSKSITVVCENLETLETHNMPDIIQQHQEIREQAALNFPLVTEFFVAKLRRGSCDWFQSLYGIFRTLIMDPQYTVRVIVAKIFIQVLHIFGPAYYSSIETDFMKLLSDKRIEVLKSLAPHLAQILLKLTEGEEKELPHQEDISAIGQSLLLCENSLCDQLDWRIYCTFLEQLEVLPFCYSSDFIYTCFLDHLMNRVTTVRQLPCRLALSHTILVLLRYNVSDKQCSDIRNRLCERLLICGNSYMRMSYLHLCSQALEIFSRKYFKDNFFCNVLQLGGDRIANVRMSVAKLLPKLKTLLVFPADHDKMLQIQFLLTQLLNDTDRDVLSCAKDANKQIETNKHNIPSDTEDKYLEQEEDKLKSSNDGKLFNILSNDLRYKKFRITENQHYKMLSGSYGMKTANEKSYTYSSIGEHDFIVDTGVCITSIPSRIPSPRPVATSKYRNCEMKLCSQREKSNLIDKEIKCESQLKERKNVKCSETLKNIKYHSHKSSLLQENSGSNENVNANSHFSIMDVKNGNILLSESHQSTQMHVINSLNFSDKPNDIVKNGDTGKNITSSSGSCKKESYILKEQTVPTVENPKYKPDSSTFLRSSMKRLNLLDDKKGNAISKSKNTNNLNTMLQSNNESPIVFRKTSNYRKKRNSFVGDFTNSGVGTPKKNTDYARKRFSLVEAPVPIDSSNKSNPAEICDDIACGKSNTAIQYEKRNSIPKRTSQYVSKKSFNDGKALEPNCRKINNTLLQGASNKQNSDEGSTEKETRIIADFKETDTHLETVIKSSDLKFSDEKLLDHKLVPDVNIHGNSNDAQAVQVSKRGRKTNDIKIMSENEQGSKKRHIRNSTLLSTYNSDVSKHPNTSGKTESKSFSKLSEITTNQSNKKRQSFIDCSQNTKSDGTKSQTDSKHRRHSSLERPKTIKTSSQPPNSKLPVLRRQIHPT